MNVPLTEKFKPREFEEVIGIEELSSIVKLMENPSDIPNLLFYGPQGTGKTTVANIIINKLKPVDYIKINCSDSTGVDNIRDKVYNFITSMSSQPDKPKIVWMEECDYLSPNAWAALRKMMEDYIKNARFIATCNYLSKLPDPILSRFTSIEFNKPKDLEIYKRIRIICNIENIIVEDKLLMEIIVRGMGDVRSIINTIQQLSANTERTIIKIEEVNDFTEIIYKLIIKKEWSKIRYAIEEKNPDYVDLLVKLDKMFFDSDLSVPIKSDINEIISRGLFELKDSFSESILFSAVCSRIIKLF